MSTKNQPSMCGQPPNHRQNASAERERERERKKERQRETEGERKGARKIIGRQEAAVPEVAATAEAQSVRSS